MKWSPLDQPPTKLNRNQLFGLRGEKIAKNYLKKKGYKILEERFRTRFGEIDLIATRKHTLFFVEVKFRSSLSHGHPLESITPFKLKSFKKAVLIYLSKNEKIREEYDVDFLAISIFNKKEKLEIDCVPMGLE